MYRLFTLFLLAVPLNAQADSKPSIGWPVDCTVGQTCWIARYTDRDPTLATQDYLCGERTQDDHNGTDIMLSDQIRMHEGIAILAAADGIVSRLRDGMEDRAAPGEEVRRVAGRECGNSMIIDHEDGWQTQYCHLRRGSLTVAQGDRVRRGDQIGLVGLSGATEFPHLHFVLRHRGKEIDPFDGNSIHQSCGKNHQPLWAEDIPYTPFLLLPVGLGTNVIHKDDIWTGYHLRDHMPKPSLHWFSPVASGVGAKAISGNFRLWIPKARYFSRKKYS